MHVHVERVTRSVRVTVHLNLHSASSKSQKATTDHTSDLDPVSCFTLGTSTGIKNAIPATLVVRIEYTSQAGQKETP